jgi:nucleotide-binding universal stress UspA family protein
MLYVGWGSSLSKRAQYSFIGGLTISFAAFFSQEIIMSQDLAVPSTPTKILVPLDFSTSSAAALAMATALAQRFGAELHLLHVVPMLPVINGVDNFPQIQISIETTFMKESQDRAEQSLAKCMGPIVSLGVKASSTAEIGSDVVGSILEAIESQHIDLVVISTHGISGWRPLVFGSIAEKLIRLVQCPLMLLRSSEPLESLPA